MKRHFCGYNCLIQYNKELEVFDNVVIRLATFQVTVLMIAEILIWTFDL